MIWNLGISLKPFLSEHLCPKRTLCATYHCNPSILWFWRNYWKLKKTIFKNPVSIFTLRESHVPSSVLIQSVALFNYCKTSLNFWKTFLSEHQCRKRWCFVLCTKCNCTSFYDFGETVLNEWVMMVFGFYT